MSEQVNVFICYAEEDREIARRLYKDLKKAGVTPWMDVEDILPGQDRKIEIREAIKKSSYFLALLSSNAVSKRGHFNRELKIALDIFDEIPLGDIFIVPIHVDKLDSCNRLDERLQNLQGVNLFQSYEDGKELILSVLLKTKPDQIPPKKTNGFGMEFVYIQPGTFMMGSPKDENGRDSNEIHHQVTLTKGFYMQSTQVTQKQWKALNGGNNPSKFKKFEDSPVERVSWNQVQDFIKRLNNEEKSDKYRLPTEAEWEYACRAGSSTLYCFGNDKNMLKEYAWHDKNSDSGSHPVGRLNPNAWELYDMHGNVWEWCFGRGDYPTSPVIESNIPMTDSIPVLRGGSWYHNEYCCRSANRKKGSPESSYSYYGFRIVLLP